MLYRDAAKIIRRLIQDEQAPFRWSDDALIRAVNSALSVAQLIRPDIWIGQGASLPVSLSTDTPIDIDQEVPMRAPWVYALPFLAAADLHRSDTELTSPEKVVELEARGKALLQ